MSENVDLWSNDYITTVVLSKFQFLGFYLLFQHSGCRLWTTKTLRNMKFVVTWGPQGDRWACRDWGERRSSWYKDPKMQMRWGTERGPSEMFVKVLCRYKTFLTAQVLLCLGKMFVFFFWWAMFVSYRAILPRE